MARPDVRVIQYVEDLDGQTQPLGLSPSPSVFLSAVTQRTERLRFGPMVYVLSTYHPLRILEEICMRG